METKMISGQDARITMLSKAQGAFIAAALGDALGWPLEFMGRRQVLADRQRVEREVLDTPKSWTRRSGDRFHPYTETINAGEYSDDTQLMLCSARSLLADIDWWSHFTQIELPSWMFYERGGGRATKAAVASWLVGGPPWSRRADKAVEAYFAAGGNGAAMRIMPHSLWHATDATFEKVRSEVLKNAICTHGHPRALVGALAYAFALWRAFKQSETLKYGLLIEETISSKALWGTVSDDLPVDWNEAAVNHFERDFGRAWDRTVGEMIELLEVCRSAIREAALSVDDKVLHDLGCYDPVMKGAGTTTAAGAIFLASRYAADPHHGLIQAASARGTDTDTLASMTGAILGAVAGSEWLGIKEEDLQDSMYLRYIAERLAAPDLGKSRSILEVNSKPVTSQKHSEVRSSLEKSNIGESVKLPDGRPAKLISRETMSSKKSQVPRFKLRTTDGQTLYIKGTSKQLKQDLGEVSALKVSTAKQRRTDVPHVGVKLPVSDMAESRRFYGEALGLPLVRESPSVLNFGGAIVLVSEFSENHVFRGAAKSNAIVFLETDAIERVLSKVVQFGATLLTDLTIRMGRKFFSCYDPDGNIIEIYASSKRPSAEPQETNKTLFR